MIEAAHAGLIARLTPRGWAGVLIEGPSGVGKSDLALRALDAGFRLVADDRVLLWTSGGALYGRAPDPLSGLIEARGVGVAPVAALRLARVVLVVGCAEGPESVERLPDPAQVVRAGLALPHRRLWPLEPAAPSKLRRALADIGHGD